MLLGERSSRTNCTSMSGVRAACRLKRRDGEHWDLSITNVPRATVLIVHPSGGTPSSSGTPIFIGPSNAVVRDIPREIIGVLSCDLTLVLRALLVFWEVQVHLHRVGAAGRRQITVFEVIIHLILRKAYKQRRKLRPPSVYPSFIIILCKHSRKRSFLNHETPELAGEGNHK